MTAWNWFWVYAIVSWVSAWVMGKMTPWMLDRICREHEPYQYRHDYRKMANSIRLCFLFAPIGGTVVLAMLWIICIGQRIDSGLSRLVDRMFRFIGL